MTTGSIPGLVGYGGGVKMKSRTKPTGIFGDSFSDAEVFKLKRKLAGNTFTLFSENKNKF